MNLHSPTINTNPSELLAREISVNQTIILYKVFQLSNPTVTPSSVSPPTKLFMTPNKLIEIP